MATTESLPVIRQLSASVINKIAAGEVIERPASVLKELLENSVDAGADRIDILVEKGGTDLIRVADNGCGMTPEQLPLAIASHATSKIKTADDLFQVHTLGFRGEAVASISEVSQFTIRSRVHDSDAGYQLEVFGGDIKEVVPCGCPVGTCIEVKNLFFNTPVRRKFMKTTQTEMGHCIEAMTRIALAYPHVHFKLQHGSRTVHDLSPVTDWKVRIASLFGQEVADALIEVEGEDGEIRLSGFVANPELSRGNNKMQYLFLNGRHIRDRSLQHALTEAYRGLLLHGRYPVSFLNLELPPDQIDVNVHPTKMEVRFQDSGKIYSQFLGTLRSRFLSTDLTAKVQPVSETVESQIKSTVDSSQESSVRDSVVAWARGGSTDSTSTSTGSGTSSTSPSFAPTSRADEQTGFRFDPPQPQTPLPVAKKSVPEFQPFDQRSTGQRADGPTSFENDQPTSPQPMPTVAKDEVNPDVVPNYLGAIQAHNRYLITESDEGVVVIDQHALHERILYEEIRDKVLAGQLETQRLLVPETVHMTASESAALLESKDLLSDLGIEIEDFGGDTILVSSYPAMLANINPCELVRQVAEQLTGDGNTVDRRDLIDELLHMISCKAAIKAGDKLSPEEIQALIERRHLVQDSHHCPHGRPTTLVFTREELDKRFKRI